MEGFRDILLEKRRRLRKEKGLDRNPFKIAFTGTGAGTIRPFGRARNLPADEISQRYGCSLLSAKGEQEIITTIDPDGLAYPCLWRATAPLGSAAERPVDKLYAEAWKDPIMGALFFGGPKEVASRMGLDTDSEVLTRTPCVKCEELFEQLSDSGTLEASKIASLV